MPFQVRVHSGTVDIIDCDIDGYAVPAVAAIGDTGVATVTIIDSNLGATRYDANGAELNWGTAVVTSSKTNNVARDRVNLALTRVAFDPSIETHGGTSIRVGSTVIDQFSQAGSTFLEGGAGSPHVAVFEDFPSVSGAGGIASGAAVGTPTITKRAFIRPSGLVSRGAVGTPKLTQQQFVRPVWIDTSIVGTPTVVQGAPPLQILHPAGVASGQAVGVPTLTKRAFVRPAGVASIGAVGVPRLVKGAAFIRPAGIAPGAVGTPAVGALGRISPAGVTSKAAVGVPTLRATRTLAPAGVPSAAAVGTPRLRLSIRVPGIAGGAVGTPTVLRGSTRLTPAGIPSAQAVGAPTITTANLIGFAGRVDSEEAVGTPTVIRTTAKRIQVEGVPSRGGVGIPHVIRVLGKHEAIGPIQIAHDLEQEIVGLLKTWLPTYLLERAHQEMKTVPVPDVKSWQSVDTDQEWATSKLPGISVMVESEGEIEVWEESVSVWLPVRVLVVASARDVKSTERLSKLYSGAVRTLLMHHPPGSAVKYSGTSWDLVGEDATLGTALVSYSVLVDDAFERYSGLASPPPVGSPPPDDLTVHEVDITTQIV